MLVRCAIGQGRTPNPHGPEVTREGWEQWLPNDRFNYWCECGNMKNYSYDTCATCATRAEIMQMTERAERPESAPGT